MNIEVLLTGSFGVGKSSIFNRFIHDEFSNKYYGTMGVRVNEKEIKLKNTTVTIKLWDIAGEISQNKVPKTYFNKKAVIIYVIDISRPFTFKNIVEDIKYLNENAPQCLIKIIGNKKDLLTDEQLVELKEKQLPVALDWFASAKSGENIIALFDECAEEIAHNSISS